MKKFTAVILLSIGLLSCKKETKTVTKTDPVTGKTVTVEVPVENTEKSESSVQAIKDSSGIFHQKFILEKGKTYPLTTYQRDNRTMSMAGQQSQTGTSEATDEMSFTVVDFKNSVYDITINLISKRNSQTAQGKTIVVDTKAAAPKEEQLKMMWTVNKALTGNKLFMKMDENGKVFSVTGFDPIYKKINAAVSPMIKDAKARNGAIESMKKGFNEKVMKDQFTKNLLIFPAKGVKIGEKWTKSENASPDGKTKLNTTYTLKNVADGIAEISLNGGIPYKSAKETQNGLTHSISNELSQNGTIKFDTATGWIHNQNINVKTTQKETISDGKKTESVSTVSNSTVMVNPSNK